MKHGEKDKNLNLISPLIIEKTISQTAPRQLKSMKKLRSGVIIIE